jgi:MFS transporter, CP family, cyanate transporter
MPASAIALVRDTLASPRPWLLALTFGFYAAQWIAVISFLPTLYLEAGIALTLAGPLTALAAAANVIGTIGSGALLQRGFTRATLVAAASATMFVCAWIAFGTDAPLAVRYAAVFAFSAGGGLIPGTLFATTLAYAPYPQAVSTTTGLMQQGAAIGQFIGPPLVAAVASASGHWGNTWLVTGALAAICLALALAIARTDRRLALCARAERSAHGSRTG